MNLQRLLCAVLLLCLAGTAAIAAEPAPATQAESQQVLVLLRLPAEHFRADGNYAGSYGDGLGRSARRRVALQLAREHGLQLAGDWPMPALGLDCYVMAVPESRQPAQVAEGLSRDRRVEWAQAMQVYRAQQPPPQAPSSGADPLLPAQPNARAWRLAELHRLATGRNVRVALIDSLADRQHPDLAGQVVQHEDFVDETHQATTAGAEQHGTAVAGLLAARGGNGVGIVGVAPQARLLALRACHQLAPDSTVCTSLALAKALYFALGSEARIINLSLSGPADRLLARLIDLALARGISVVAAYDRSLPQGGFPASHAGVVAVADDDTAPPAGSGALQAPARDLPTTTPGGRWGFVSGASYAAAQVSGLLALLRELQPGAAAPPLVRAPDGGIDTCATLLQARAGGGNSGSDACAALPLAAHR